MTDDTLDNAYQVCLKTAQQHYENFPTAARLLAKPHRRATAAIYAFARGADDIADEGSISADERHRQLDHYADQLIRISSGDTPTEPIFIALADTIVRYQLPITPFTKLLQAFRQDIETIRYSSFSTLTDYCEHSANPVGELILRLHGIWTEANAIYSDRICTALQLINFLQDIDSDYQDRGRLYIPQTEIHAFGLDESAFAQRVNSRSLHDLINHQINRASLLLHEGVPLLRNCPWRLRTILKITILSADRIVEKLLRRHDVFSRPALQATDITLIALRSLMFQP